MEKESTQKPQPGIFQQIFGLIILLIFGWGVGFIFVAPVRDFTGDLLLKFGVDLRANRIALVEENLDRMRNANPADVVPIEIVAFSQEWEAMTSVQQEAREKELKGKIVEMTHMVYDVTRRSDLEDGTARFDIMFMEDNLLTPALPVSCDFSVADEQSDATLTGLTSGAMVTFRGKFESVGFTGLKLEKCALPN